MTKNNDLNLEESDEEDLIPKSVQITVAAAQVNFFI